MMKLIKKAYFSENISGQNQWGCVSMVPPVVYSERQNERFELSINPELVMGKCHGF